MNEKILQNEQKPTAMPEDEDQVIDDGLSQIEVGLSADDEDVDIVDWASDSSFPASDPPPWSPGIV